MKNCPNKKTIGAMPYNEVNAMLTHLIDQQEEWANEEPPQPPPQPEVPPTPEVDDVEEDPVVEQPPEYIDMYNFYNQDE